MILGTGAIIGTEEFTRGRLLALVSVLLLCLCVNSWGACQSGSYSDIGGWIIPGCYGGSSLPSCGSWTPAGAKCTTSGYCLCSEYTFDEICGSVRQSGSYYYTNPDRFDYPTTNCTSPPSVRCHYSIRCSTQAEADSTACVNQEGMSWDGAECHEANTKYYHCQNSGGAVSGGFGSAQKALIYECDGEVCNLQQELAGTCQDWGYCEGDQNDCDITDSTKRVPCALSGNGTSTNGKCYYSCGNGKNYTCKSKYSTWGGDGTGDVYIGRCDSYPSETCAPGLYNSDSSSVDTTETCNPFTGCNPVPNDSSVIDSDIGSDDTDTQRDYTRLLKAIHDTLTLSLQNHRAQTWYQWSIDSVLKNNIYYDLEQLNNYQNALNQRDMEKFSLMQETGEDIRQARNLLDSIKNFDTLNVATATDTAYTNRMDTISDRLKEIRDWNDTSSNMFTKLRNWYTSMFGDSTAIAKRNSCEQVAKTCQNSTSSGAEYMACLKQHDCLQVDGGTPWDAGVNMINRGFDAIIDALFDDDSTSVPVDTTDVDTLPQSVQNLIDSLRNYNIPDLNLDSIQNLLDSLKNDTSSVEINSDSLVTDLDDIKDKFSDYMLPSGSGGGCYTLDVNLGDFGGLAKQDLKIYIDFSNFGGFNFCEIGRSIIRIMTLVVCISLTLGSWAAAFGWNKSTGD